MEETTLVHPLKYRLRFRFYEFGHKCKIKVKPQNVNRRILCDCAVVYSRITRRWYYPIMWLGNRPFLRNRFTSFIRKYITLD